MCSQLRNIFPTKPRVSNGVILTCCALRQNLLRTDRPHRPRVKCQIQTRPSNKARELNSNRHNGSAQLLNAPIFDDTNKKQQNSQTKTDFTAQYPTPPNYLSASLNRLTTDSPRRGQILTASTASVEFLQNCTALM